MRANLTPNPFPRGKGTEEKLRESRASYPPSPLSGAERGDRSRIGKEGSGILRSALNDIGMGEGRRALQLCEGLLEEVRDAVLD